MAAGGTLSELPIRVRPRRTHPAEDRVDVAGHVDLRGSGHPVVGHAHGVGVGALRRVAGLHRVAPLDDHDVTERLPYRPLPFPRRPVEEIFGQADEEAAQVTEGALGEGEDAAGLGVRECGEADQDLLGVLESAVERIADVRWLVAKTPELGQLLLVQRGESREGHVDPRAPRHARGPSARGRHRRGWSFP